MNLKLLGIGWKSKVLLKRSTFYVSINKLVAEGCFIEKGQEVLSCLAEDDMGKKAIIIYLDSKKKTAKKEKEMFMHPHKHMS